MSCRKLIELREREVGQCRCRPISSASQRAESPRDTEYRLFAEVTRALMEAAKADRADLKARVTALDWNRRLWATLSDGLRQPREPVCRRACAPSIILTRHVRESADQHRHSQRRRHRPARRGEPLHYAGPRPDRPRGLIGRRAAIDGGGLIFGLILAGGTLESLRPRKGGGASCRQADDRLGGRRAAAPESQTSGDQRPPRIAGDRAIAIRGGERTCLPDPPGSADGPLSGVLEGLRWATRMKGGEALVTAPCDTPFLPADYVRRMMGEASNGGWRSSSVTPERSGTPSARIWPVSCARRRWKRLTGHPPDPSGASRNSERNGSRSFRHAQKTSPTSTRPEDFTAAEHRIAKRMLVTRSAPGCPDLNDVQQPQDDEDSPRSGRCRHSGSSPTTVPEFQPIEGSAPITARIRMMMMMVSSMGAPLLISLRQRRFARPEDDKPQTLRAVPRFSP